MLYSSKEGERFNPLWIPVVLIILFLMFISVGCSPSEEYKVTKCVTMLLPSLQTITVKQDPIQGNVTFSQSGVSTTIDGMYYHSTIFTYGTCTGE